MSGYFVDNSMPLVTGALLSGDSRVPVDTMISGGSSPQSGGMVPGTLPAPPVQIGLTALVGGAKAGATQLGYGANTVTVVATDGDSVLMPYAYPGAVVVVVNADSGQDIRAYGRGTDTINGVATATGNLQGEGTTAIYVGVAGIGDGTDAGEWYRVLSA